MISEDCVEVLCDLNLAELINQQIRRLRKGCQESITILNLTTFVVFPHNEVTDKKTADTFLVDSFHALWFPAFSGVDVKIYERSFFSRPLHSQFSFRVRLSRNSYAPPNGELARTLGTG